MSGADLKFQESNAHFKLVTVLRQCFLVHIIHLRIFIYIMLIYTSINDIMSSFANGSPR